MSMSIHSGFRIQAGDIDRFLTAMPSFERAAAAIGRKEQAAHLAEGLVTKIDSGRKASFQNAVKDARDSLAESERLGQRNVYLDKSFSYLLIAFDGDMLGMAFTESPGIRAEWQGIPGWQDYSYWDGSDRPAGLSKEEWSKRRSDWKTAMPTMVPANHGKTIDLLPARIDVTLEDVMDSLPSDVWRQRKLGAGRAVAACGIQMDTIEGVLDALAWLRSEDGELAILTEMGKGTPLVPITSDMMG